jgi:hypothetical protein
MMPYIDQITNQDAFAAQPTRLIPLTDVGTNPCVQEDTHGHIYATWLQYDDNNQYGLFLATTARPPASTFWTKLGLSATAPIQQLIFILLGSMLAAAFMTLVSMLGVPVAAVLVKVGQLLHVHRLALLLVGLVPLLVIDVFAQRYMASDLATPTPPTAWPVIGSAVAVAVLLYLWFRSRKVPTEVLGTVGRDFLASYFAAFIFCLPILYFSVPT